MEMEEYKIIRLSVTSIGEWTETCQSDNYSYSCFWQLCTCSKTCHGTYSPSAPLY